MTRPRPDVVLERWTRDYYLPMQRVGYVAEGHNSHMLFEDVSNGVFPFALGRGNQSRVRLEPYDPKVERLIADGLEDRTRYSASPLEDSLAEWFRLCAREIARGGRVVYEIGYLVRRSDGRADGFRLLRINPDSIERHGDVLVQQVPAGARARDYSVVEEGDLTLPSETLIIPAERILIFEMPVAYRREWQRIRRDLAFIDRNDPAALTIRRMEAPAREQFPFDWDLHHATYGRAVAEVTRAVGWNRREIVNLQQGYSWMVRHLRFKRFVITVRDEMMATLNDGLRRIGEHVGFRGQLVLQGVPTLADVDEAERLLWEGSKPFAEITAPFYPR